MKVAAAAGCVLLAVLFILTVGSVSQGKDKPIPRPRFYKPDVREEVSDIVGFDPRANVIAAVDTYCIVWYDFEAMSWQGWTRFDNTVQVDTFVTVEDFAGLGGGSHGRLVPIEGTKSVWIGARPENYPALCSWPPGIYGYGNDWVQKLDFWGPDTLVEISYHLVCDTEEGKDIIEVGWNMDHGGETWATYSGVVDTIATHVIEKSWSTEWGADYSFRFTSDGAVSDWDALIDTDGACIIDSITVKYDGSVFDYEDFESFAAGTVPYGRWRARTGNAYGAHSGIMNNLVDRDPCNNDFGTQIIFFNGSTYPGPDYPWPGLFVTPYCTGSGAINKPCQDDMIVSPVIDLNRYSSGCNEYRDTDIPPGELDGLGGYKLIYQVYLDNPIENLVFHTWKVRSIVDGCPQDWQSEPLVMYYGEDKLYYWLEHDISGMVESDLIQVALGVVDMCYLWYGIYGDCAEHTPAPWLDNVRIQRYSTVGPQWSYQGADLFQDNFPSTDVMSSYVRADMAADISPPSWPGIVPGDSVVVSCWAPNAGGLDTLGTGEARVYFHCNVIFFGLDGKPDLFGPQLEGNYGTFVSDDGDWTVLLCEPARSSSGAIAQDKYCIDLNDSLFTRGYRIEYYFMAYDLDGISTTLPPNAETLPLYGGWNENAYRFEFECLPSLRVVPNLLFVDDFDGRGTWKGLVQTYFDHVVTTALSAALDIPDRYDVNQPSAMAGNGLGSRARLAHFYTAYSEIMWDSGDLAEGTLVSGESTVDKSDDIGFLLDYLDTLPWGGRHGVMVMGDNAASDISRYSDGQILLRDWFGVSLVSPSYLELTGGFDGGGTVIPHVTAPPANCMWGVDFYLFGGCPNLAHFDVFDTTGIGIPQLAYPEYGGETYYAGVWADGINSLGRQFRTQWYGFSFMRIRDGSLRYPIRNAFLNAAWRCVFHGPSFASDITDDEIPAVTALAAVYPNPFNPVTRVSFSLKQKGHISMRVYDVSGRLVRVLIDEVREAGAYEVAWDGANDRGRSTASGIYFCRMEADDYQRTVKMVLLR